MTGFTKLFPELIRSTVWVGTPWYCKAVWIVLLAQADGTGCVMTSVPGLARDAEVSIEEAEKALQFLQEPDRYSRTPDNDGRRIEKCDGGYRLLNHAKYRAARDEDARREYRREWMRQRRDTDKSSKSVNTFVNTREQSGPRCTEAEAEAEADKPMEPSVPCRAAPDAEPVRQEVDKSMAEARQALAFLNRVVDRQFEGVKANLDPIRARIKEVGLRAVKAVVLDRKDRWLHDDKMREFLRPATLFAASKFHQYLAEAKISNPQLFQEKPQ